MSKMSDIESVLPAADPVSSKTVAEVFGEIVWIASQDEEGRKLSVADLEWLVMPSIILRQFHIQYVPISIPSDATGQSAHARADVRPIAVELYALCSPDVKQKLSQNPNSALTLQEWRSGSEKVTVRRFKAGAAAKRATNLHD